MMTIVDTQNAVAASYTGEVLSRIQALAADAAAGVLDAAIGLMAGAIQRGGVIQAFGTGHSEAFAMELSGRAGGLIPTNKIALRDVVVHGTVAIDALRGSSLERDAAVVDELYSLTNVGAEDVFVIASNSGVNGSIVGLALLAQQHGHPVIAVTSLEHTMKLDATHASGKRLTDVADVVIDNKAPFGDVTVRLDDDVVVGAVSSITGAYIAQLLTIGVALRLSATGTPAPVYLSANIPGGEAHNAALEAQYQNKIRREA